MQKQYTSCTQPTNQKNCENAIIPEFTDEYPNGGQCSWNTKTKKCYTTAFDSPTPPINPSNTPGNNIDISKLNERSEQTLADIQSLQAIEKELYENLEKNSGTSTITPEEKNQIINKINEISQMRMNLYDNLKNTYSFYQKNVSSSRNTLDEQSSAVGIVEQELNESKKKFQLLQDEKYNKLRLVEINTYYGKTYNAHAAIMKIIVVVCIPVLILAILANNELIPRIWYGLLSSIIIIIGIVTIGYMLLNLYNRSNTNFDEYEWAFNPNDVATDSSTSSTTSTSSPWTTPVMTCVGEMCCTDGMYYDTTNEKCEVGVDPTSTTTTTTDPVTGITTTTTTPSTTTTASTTSSSPASTTDATMTELFMNISNSSPVESFNNYNLSQYIAI
jgi:hypothetical protein